MIEETTIENSDKKYEIVFLIKEEDTSKIKELLEKNGAVVTDEKPLQKMAMMYKIKKQVHAFSGSFNFTLAPEKIEKLTGALNLMSDVIRHMITLENLKIEKRRDPGEKMMTMKKPTSIEDAMKKPFENILTNEAIEKKIEEILK